MIYYVGTYFISLHISGFVSVFIADKYETMIKYSIFFIHIVVLYVGKQHTKYNSSKTNNIPI